MNLALQITAAAIAAGMLAGLYRALRGPTIWDRLSGLGAMLTKTIVLLLVAGELSGHLEAFVDIALCYAMVAFVGTLALARYFELRGQEP